LTVSEIGAIIRLYLIGGEWLNRIKEIRLLVGMSQGELARAANISQPYLFDLEHGARGAKPETLARIAEKLGVRVEDLKFEKKTA
jgi:transcriptional regulator with XRE-family HTH domain